MTGAVAGLLTRTLAAIREECPLAWGELLRQGEGIRIALEVDDERFAVRGTRSELRVGRIDGDASIHVHTSVSALQRVILGERELVESIRRDEILVTGAPDDLVRLDRLTWLVVAGAARSVSAAPLLDELLEQSPEPKPINPRKRGKR